MSWRQAVERSLLFPAQPLPQNGGKVEAVELRLSRDADEMGRQPLLERGEQALIGEIGPIRCRIEPP